MQSPRPLPGRLVQQGQQGSRVLRVLQAPRRCQGWGGGVWGVSGPLKSGPGNADPFPALGLGQAQNLPGNVCQRSFLRFHANHQELNTLKNITCYPLWLHFFLLEVSWLWR